MKKVFAAVLVILLAFGLCACGAGNAPKIEDVLAAETPWYEFEGELLREDLLEKWGEPETSEDSCDIWNVNGKFVAAWYEGEGVTTVNRSSTLHAEIIEISGDLAIIEPAEGQWERSSGDRIFFSLSWLSEEDAALAEVGTKLVIEYNGSVMETYPLQIEKPYYAAIER